MAERHDILRDAMRQSVMTQTQLAQLSGVRQPSISQMLSGTISMSDEQLARLLHCMGYELEITRTAVEPALTRVERRSWMLHREIGRRLTESTFQSWKPKLLHNVERQRMGVRGSIHLDNVARWRTLIENDDVAGLRRALVGLDRRSIEMREVGPFSGLLPDHVRLEVLAKVRQ